MAEHLVYVISDLHLGGAPGATASDRGFRICTQGDALAGFIEALAAQPTGPGAPRTELVINGDFVDFLAEKDEPVAWTALKEDPERARLLFERIVERNRPVFQALARFIKRGHTLTVLIGNHDIELAFPAVRQALAAALGLGAGAPLCFLHDGEAYAVGDALIEHGNRYDGFNAVDFDALRRVRSIQSRGLPVPADRRLTPPPGSQLVAEVMNPLKQYYPFIDLLKPEAEAAVPLLLALAPGAWRPLARTAALVLKSRQHKLRSPAMPERTGDIAAVDAFGPLGGAGGAGLRDGGLAGGELLASRAPAFDFDPMGPPPATSDSDEAALRQVLREELGTVEAERFLHEIDAGTAPLRRADPFGGGDRGDIAAFVDEAPGASRGLLGTLQGGLAWARLLLISDDALNENRLSALHTALRNFCGPDVFDPEREPEDSRYLAAAKEMAQGRYRYVVMGHTHLCRSVPLPGGGRYLNSGTWADLMRMPAAVLTEGDNGRAALRGLVEDLRAQRFASLLWQRPTYARLELVGDRVQAASIEEYSGGHGRI
ncbi:MAG: hypothetical protein U1A78_04220 [Polyangia bacterium]